MQIIISCIIDSFDRRYSFGDYYIEHPGYCLPLAAKCPVIMHRKTNDRDYLFVILRDNFYWFVEIKDFLIVWKFTLNCSWVHSRRPHGNVTLLRSGPTVWNWTWPKVGWLWLAQKNFHTGCFIINLYNDIDDFSSSCLHEWKCVVLVFFFFFFVHLCFILCEFFTSSYCIRCSINLVALVYYFLCSVRISLSLRYIWCTFIISYDLPFNRVNCIFYPFKGIWHHSFFTTRRIRRPYYTEWKWIWKITQFFNEFFQARIHEDSNRIEIEWCPLIRNPWLVVTEQLF